MLRRAEQPRSRTADVDLLPQVAPRRRLPLLDFFMEEPYWLIAAIGLVALYFLVGERTNVSTQLASMKEQVAEAELRSQVSLPREVRDLRDQLEAARKRIEGIESASRTLKERQWPWGHLVRLITDLKPEGVYLKSVTQGEDMGALVVEGSTDQETSVLDYAAVLKRSGLFSEVTIRSIAARVKPGEQGPVTVPGLAQLPVVVPSPLVPPPAALPRATPTPTPTPVFDYVLASQTRTTRSGAGRPNEIRGQVVDQVKEPVPGLTFRISSCCPLWSALYPKGGDTPSSGAFEFFVGAGTFRVELADAVQGRAQAATQLHTGDLGPGEYVEWHVVFEKVADTPRVPLAPIPTFVPTPAGRPALGTPAAGGPSTSPTATQTPTSGAPSAPSPIGPASLAVPPGATLTQTPGAAAGAAPSPSDTRGVVTFAIVVTLKPMGAVAG